MCVVSMVGDFYGDKFRKYHPIITSSGDSTNYIFSTVSRDEFDALKKEVEDMKELLRRAKIYDEVNDEKDCEIEEKMEFLRKVAELVGIDLDDVLKKHNEKSQGS